MSIFTTASTAAASTSLLSTPPTPTTNFLPFNPQPTSLLPPATLPSECASAWSFVSSLGIRPPWPLHVGTTDQFSSSCCTIPIPLDQSKIPKVPDGDLIAPQAHGNLNVNRSRLTTGGSSGSVRPSIGTLSPVFIGCEADAVGRVHINTLQLTYPSICSAKSFPSVNGLSNLQKLQVQGCDFGNAQVPWADLVKATPFMQHLILTSSKLSGPITKDIANWTELREIRLDTNGFEGQIPSEIGQLTKLRTVSFADNLHLNGSIPASIGNLSSLTIFNIAGDQFRGPLPSLPSTLVSCNLRPGSSDPAERPFNLPTLPLPPASSASPATLQQNAITPKEDPLLGLGLGLIGPGSGGGALVLDESLQPLCVPEPQMSTLPVSCRNQLPVCLLFPAGSALRPDRTGFDDGNAGPNGNSKAAADGSLKETPKGLSSGGKVAVGVFAILAFSTLVVIGAFWIRRKNIETRRKRRIEELRKIAGLKNIIVSGGAGGGAHGDNNNGGRGGSGGRFNVAAGGPFDDDAEHDVQGVENRMEFGNGTGGAGGWLGAGGGDATNGHVAVKTLKNASSEETLVDEPISIGGGLFGKFAVAPKSKYPPNRQFDDGGYHVRKTEAAYLGMMGRLRALRKKNGMVMDRDDGAALGQGQGKWERMNDHDENGIDYDVDGGCANHHKAGHVVEDEEYHGEARQLWVRTDDVHLGDDVNRWVGQSSIADNAAAIKGAEESRRIREGVDRDFGLV
ncbi:hypothetical protein HDU76_002214 [Blyttiomyces sp. JEL0837]|nr:hypothetical protein HDU76_002214 [Blyttiomyces sp. JEL0837]